MLQPCPQRRVSWFLASSSAGWAPWFAAWLALVGALGASKGSAQEHLSDYVNPLRGTDSQPGYSRGNTFPAATLPFGFNFWTPVTDGNSDNWLYAYDKNQIQGISVSHEPSPWIADHGTIQIMPMTGSLRAAPGDRASTFSHDHEISRAHYYSVDLATYGIRAELTPTDHAAVFRFTFPSAANAYILFDSIDSVNGEITVNQGERTVTGYTDHRGPRFYFYARVDKAIAGVEDPAGGGTNMALRFGTNANEVVTMKMGTSFISVDQARKNLEQEVGEKTFDQVFAAAQAVWDEALGHIELEGASESQKVTFYSCLYRALMYPNSMWELVDGKPQYFSPYAHALRDGKIYVNNGFWDTFRAAWPLYSLLVPEKAGEMLDGFVNAYKDGGWTPRWTGPGYIDIMVGSHSDIVFADAYMKGIRNFDVDGAYASMLKNALVYSGNGALGRKGQARSIFKGYIPVEDLGESAAWYLEDVINDFGISQVAKALGDETHARYFREKSLTYRNLFSESTGFFRGKRADGTFRTSDADFKPNEWGYEFTEGCPWHYTMAAHNDPRGMANLYGSGAAMAAKIDALFSAPRDYLVGSYGGIIHEMVEAFDTDMGQYAHANEPIHHMLYMYNYAGLPAKTQQRVRDVMDESKGVYGSGVGTGGGYLGDEDNGQMSAWFVFSAMGFYPASPGHPEYAIGSPLFRRVTLHLENGHDFVIDAPDNTLERRYIQSAMLEGVPHTKNFLTHEQITAGGTLALTMGAEPSNWGSAPADLPTSITRTARAPVPMSDRARGGTASASEENAANGEGAAQAFDDDSATKWLTNAGSGTLQYQFAGGRKYTVSLYTLTSGNDAPGRDPRDFQLQASNDGESWVTLDERTGEQFTERRQTRVFAADNTTPYAYYRLNVTANGGEALTQLSELELLGDAPIEAVSASGSAPCAEAEGAEHAIDGKLSQKWCTPEANAELVVDLGAQHLVSQFELAHAGAGGEDANWNSKDFSISLSTDGESYEPVVEVTGSSESETQHTIEPTQGRFVKLAVTTPTQNAATVTRIYELSTYGKRIADPNDPDGGVGDGDGDGHGDGDGVGDGDDGDASVGDGDGAGDGDDHGDGDGDGDGSPGDATSSCSCQLLSTGTPLAGIPSLVVVGGLVLRRLRRRPRTRL